MAKKADPEAEDFQHPLGLFNHGGTIDLVGREVDRILQPTPRSRKATAG